MFFNKLLKYLSFLYIYYFLQKSIFILFRNMLGVHMKKLKSPRRFNP